MIRRSARSCRNSRAPGLLDTSPSPALCGSSSRRDLSGIRRLWRAGSKCLQRLPLGCFASLGIETVARTCSSSTAHPMRKPLAIDGLTPKGLIADSLPSTSFLKGTMTHGKRRLPCRQWGRQWPRGGNDFSAVATDAVSERPLDYTTPSCSWRDGGRASTGRRSALACPRAGSSKRCRTIRRLEPAREATASRTCRAAPRRSDIGHPHPCELPRWASGCAHRTNRGAVPSSPRSSDATEPTRAHRCPCLRSHRRGRQTGAGCPPLTSPLMQTIDGSTISLLALLPRSILSRRGHMMSARRTPVLARLRLSEGVLRC